MTKLDAVVVGSGPNGLAAAIVLARAGRAVRVLEGEAAPGGSVRSEELTLPGCIHDVCSAVMPLAISSPFFRRLPLLEHGLRWVQPGLPLAHPFDDGTAAVLHRELAEMSREFPEDAAQYERAFHPLVEDWDAFAREILQPALHVPRRPWLMANFGLSGFRSAEQFARRFQHPKLRALFAGCASHAIVPLDQRLTASFGMVLMASAHAAGWPLVEGGSQGLTTALISYLKSLGGEVETSRPVRSLRDLPPHRLTLFDVAPVNLLSICADKLNARYRRQLLAYRRGESTFKVDYALSQPVPWRADACRAAGTVHVGGTLEDVVTAEHDVGQGRSPERPLVLVAQPSLFDSTRAPAGKHTLWAYTHVPFNNDDVDMADRIEHQLERFAPGFRDTVLARSVLSREALRAKNPNLVGGDITGGSNAGLQLFFRPRITLRPYDTPVRGIYICSASTPPGGGVHGMCGYWAARRALSRELR